jgi:hypothetical protein
LFNSRRYSIPLKRPKDKVDDDDEVEEVHLPIKKQRIGK